MNHLKLFNKKIVISAAADGIGWAIAQACMLNGVLVYITDKNKAALENISKNDLYGKQFDWEKNNRWSLLVNKGLYATDLLLL